MAAAHFIKSTPTSTVDSVFLFSPSTRALGSFHCSGKVKFIPTKQEHKPQVQSFVAVKSQALRSAQNVIISLSIVKMPFLLFGIIRRASQALMQCSHTIINRNLTIRAVNELTGNRIDQQDVDQVRPHPKVTNSIKACARARREFHTLSATKITFSSPSTASVGSHSSNPQEFSILKNSQSFPVKNPGSPSQGSHLAPIFGNCHPAWECSHSERLLHLMQCQPGYF